MQSITPNFRLPAEWEPHAATWLAWPHNKNDWPGKFAPIPWVYAEIIRHLTMHERVRLLVRSGRDEQEAKTILDRAGVELAQVDFWHIPTNRIWMRDSGGMIVANTKKISGARLQVSGNATIPETQHLKPETSLLLDWRFNAWAKYPNHKLDDKVPACMEPYIRLPRLQPTHKGKRVVLEGGAIDTNGKGVLITTEECLLSTDIQVRNPGFTRADYETVFAQYLGIEQVIWLGNGITGDDTHGHVDDITRFVSEDTIVTAIETNPGDANYKPLHENLQRLKAARTLSGKQYNLVELPMPRPLVFEQTRLPASYANFYIANAAVLVPTFNDPNDRIALNILAECFPTREIIGIHAVDLVWGFGTLHCMSMQEPLL